MVLYQMTTKREHLQANEAAHRCVMSPKNVYLQGLFVDLDALNYFTLGAIL